MKTNKSEMVKMFCTGALLILTTACGAKELTNHSVGGSVVGLAQGGLVLENNSSDQVVVNSSGEFTFPSQLGVTNRYRVTVAENPPGQVCSIENASGVITVSDITDVTVVCNVATHYISGAVAGLTGTLILQNNLGDFLTIHADGIFRFSTDIAEGSNYSVTVFNQPAGQTCTVNFGNGTATGDVSDISVACAP